MDKYEVHEIQDRDKSRRRRFKYPHENISISKINDCYFQEILVVYYLNFHPFSFGQEMRHLQNRNLSENRNLGSALPKLLGPQPYWRVSGPLKLYKLYIKLTIQRFILENNTTYTSLHCMSASIQMFDFGAMLKYKINKFIPLIWVSSKCDYCKWGT